MPDDFDACFEWLGIPPSEQPPNYYRLLGIPLFVDNPRVVENAADQRMGHLRTFQTGPHAAESQRLLNEVAAARICLLNPDKKAAYDERLRRAMEVTPPEEVEAVVVAPPVVDPPHAAVGSRWRPARRSWPVLAMAMLGVLVVAMGILVWGLKSGGDRREVAKQQAGRMVTDAVSTKPAASPGLADAAKRSDAAGPAASEVQAKGTTGNPPAAPSPPSSNASPKDQAGAKPEPTAAPEPPRQVADRPEKTVENKPTVNQAPVREERRQRQPAPSLEVQQTVVREVDEVYETATAKTPQEKSKLADKLAALAEKPDKPEVRFVLWRRASELALEAGEPERMLKLVVRMAEDYELDVLTVQAKMLIRFADDANQADELQSLLKSAGKVIDVALAAEQFVLADELAMAVYRACQKSAGRPYRPEALQRHKDAAQARTRWEEIQKAQAALESNPDDAEAHATVGRWHCFVKGDWEAGLSHLAKGSDATLKALAERELAFPQSAEAQVDLADAWWDTAQQAKAETRTPLWLRAGYWYQQAQPQLTRVLTKTKVAMRLEEIAKLGHPIPLAASKSPPLAVAPFDEKQAKSHQLRWAKHLKVSVELTNSINMKLTLIPPGEFMMGSTQEEVKQLLEEARQQKAPPWYTNRVASETPQHRVRISRPFYLGVYEVTQADYDWVMGSNPSRFAGTPSRPVNNVTWNDAAEFCRELGELPEEKKAKAVYRLATEAEWEYACRAGATTHYSFGDDPSRLGQYASWGKNAGSRPYSVGHFKPNAFGLFDMHGSVWEWCADWHAGDFYQKSPAEDPAGPPLGTARVMRGGCRTDNNPGCLRCELRNPAGPTYRDDGTGFRVVRIVAP
jgi:formylglycine-generating enzyme required for sulfatase activity